MKNQKTVLRTQSGLSLLEIIIASFIGMLAVTGALYIFKNQHRNMVIQTNTTNLRMNGQFSINEVQFYLGQAGLGLPNSLDALMLDGGELVIKTNSSKKFAPATMDVGASGTKVIVYQIASTDTALFSKVGRAVAMIGNTPIEAAIISVTAKGGTPPKSNISLAGDKDDFPITTSLLPQERLKLHICTGIGTDTLKGDFRILAETPPKRSGIKTDSMTMAEGLDSLIYTYTQLNGTSSTTFPSNLDSLQTISVKIIASSLVKDAHLPGDGYLKKSFSVKVNFQKSL